MNNWLLKTEPNVYSVQDLEEAGSDMWDGIRNYQARNIIRDDMKVGDKVFIYHSRVQPVGIVGEAEVSSEPYPDPTQFDASEKYYDAKADPENPRWFVVDIRHVKTYRDVLSLTDLKNMPELADMMLTKKGSRLSVQPVRESEWQFIQKLVEAM